MRSSSSNNESPDRHSGALLRASCWLALLLTIAKALSWNPSLARGFSFETVLAASWADVLFALACGATGELVQWCLRRSARAMTLARRVFLAFYAVSAAYAFAAIRLF